MVRFVLLALLIGVAIGFKMLTWQWRLGMLAGLILAVGLGLVIFRGKLFVWLFSIPFRMKGAPLRGARVEVHGLTPTQKPANVYVGNDDDDEANEPEPERDYYLLDVTITPKPTSGSFQHWEIGELSLIGPGEDIMGDRNSAPACRIASIELHDRKETAKARKAPTAKVAVAGSHESGAEDDDVADDDFDGDDGSRKVMGPHRLNLTIGVARGVRELRFQYYFEKFGAVSF